MSTAIQHEIGWDHDAERLTNALRQVVEQAPDSELAARKVVRAATEIIEQILAAHQKSAVAARPRWDEQPIEELVAPPDPAEIVTEESLHEADRNWEEARQRGEQFRDQARSLIGPLLSPAMAAARLGVSKTTLSTWRKHDKLLGVRFDGHQYLYPEFQFVSSPEMGERGVLQHLEEVLTRLGDRSGWWKARFFVTPADRLGQRTPIELLSSAAGSPVDVKRVLLLAQHFGEMGD